MGKAGRPSKLSDQKWGTLLARLAAGEKASDLARAYKVSPTSISKRISQQAESCKTLAQELASVETRIEVLPISQQAAVRSIADQIKDLRDSNLRIAAKNNAAAEHVSDRALRIAENLPDNPGVEDLRTLAAAAETSNKLTALSSNLTEPKRESVIAPSLEQLVVCTGVPRDEPEIRIVRTPGV